MNKVQWAIKIIMVLSQEGFNGKLELNFFKGGITTINKHEVFRESEVLV